MLNLRNLMKAHQIAAKFRAGIEPKALMVKEEKDTGTIYLYDQIGGDSFNEGITAKAVVAALDDLQAKGCKAVNVRIASEGGDVFEGKNIYEALKRCPMDVTTYNDSIAASAASFIAMAGKKVVTAPTATWMMHRAWALAVGNAEDLVSMSKILELEDGNIAGIYAAKTGKSVADCLALMSAETWMNAEDAKKSGFADEIARDDAAGDDDESPSSSASAKAVFGIGAQTQEHLRLHSAVALAAQRQALAKHGLKPTPK